MTKKLINRVLIISAIISFTIFLNNGISHVNCCEIERCKTCINYEITIYILLGLLLIIIAMIILMYFSGDFDNFFKEYTDPKLKKLCDFLNRRNGGCNEK